MASQNQDIEKISGQSDLATVETSNDLKTVAAEDADMALQVYNNAECTEAEVVQVDEKKLLRKIDFHLMPIVSLSPSTQPDSLLRNGPDVHCHHLIYSR